MRWVRSISGAETPTTFEFPVSDDYQAATVVGAGTNVNLNIGDPVKLGEDGCIKLTQQGQDESGANTDSDDLIFGVIAGFKRTVDGNNAVRPGSYLDGATSHAGIATDGAPIALVIPAAGNIFELDADAVLATPTKAGAMALIGRTASVEYSVLTAGVGQPKANPLIDISVAEGGAGGAAQGQLVIVGLGQLGDAMDFTATNVTFQVMASYLDLAQQADPAIFGSNVE